MSKRREYQVRLVVFILLVAARTLVAGEIRQSSVEYDAGIYHLTFDVVIDATLDSVRPIVTDYARLDQLSSMVIQSTLLKEHAADKQRRLLVIRACLLMFCRNLKVVEDVVTAGPDQFATTLVPESSDFKSGMTRWQLTQVDKQRTRIEFEGYEEPGFWIPPLLGPVLVKRRLLKEAMAVMNNIELQAKHD